MVCVREGIFKNYDFCNWTILEMIQSSWAGASESENNVNHKYYWWKVDLKKQLIKVLKERWTNNLPGFEYFKINIEDLCNNFDSRNFSDCVLYLEKLIKIKDDLKKKRIQKTKKAQKNLSLCKTFDFLIFDF